MTGYFQAQSALAQATRYIVALGDSRTAAKVGAWFGWPVVNIAIDGSTTATVLAYQVPQLAQLVAGDALYFLDIGINDIAAIMAGGETFATFEANAQAILTGMIKAGAIASSIIVSNVAPVAGTDQSQYYSWFSTSQQVAATWKSLSTSFQTLFFDAFSLFTGGTNQMGNISPTQYVAGGWHYSPSGWQAVDAAIAKISGPIGPLERI